MLQTLQLPTPASRPAVESHGFNYIISLEVDGPHGAALRTAVSALLLVLLGLIVIIISVGAVGSHNSHTTYAYIYF